MMLPPCLPQVRWQGGGGLCGCVPTVFSREGVAELTDGVFPLWYEHHEHSDLAAHTHHLEVPSQEGKRALLALVKVSRRRGWFRGRLQAEAPLP